MNRKTILVFLIVAAMALLCTTSAVAEETTGSVLERGNAALEAGSYEEALAIFDVALAEQSDVAAYHEGRGKTLVNLGRFLEAIDAFSTAAKLTPDHWNYLYERAMANYNMEQVDLAIATIDGQEIQYIGEAAYVLEYIANLKDGLEYWTITSSSELCTPEFIFVPQKEEAVTIYKVEWETEDDVETEDEGSAKREILIGGKYAYFLEDGQATIAGYLGGMWGWDWPRSNIKDATFVGIINNLEALEDLTVWHRDAEEKESTEDENDHVLVIPNRLDGYPVVAIGNGAFTESMDRGVIIIPEGVVNIGAGAFCASYYFHTLVIPDSVATIGEEAFEGCGQGLLYDSIGTDEYEFALSVTKSSYAEQYAKENNIPFVFTPATPAETADELLIKQIDEYLTMTREEIIEKLGPDFTIVPAGPEGVCDGYLYEDLGMAFAFYPDSDVPDLIDCYPNFRIHGVGIGSPFSEIMEALGDTEVIETWLELPIYTVFMVQYRLGNAEYSFVAFEKDAPADILRIRQDLYVEEPVDDRVMADDQAFIPIGGSSFTFSSGVGGWSTEVIVSEDGSFTGYFHDTDLGDTGDDSQKERGMSVSLPACLS